MKSLSIYLSFAGQTEEVFTFYQSIFKGKLEMHRYKDMPNNEKMSPNDLNKVMHASLTLDNHQILMGADWVDSMCGNNKLNVGNNFSITISPDSEAEADKLFMSLSANGGKAIMPMQKTFWNAYFGMLTDKYGINWMINCEVNQS